MGDEHKDDLPLLANVQDIIVNHYILQLTCDFQNKCFSGSLIVYLKPAAVHEEEAFCKCKLDGNHAEYPNRNNYSITSHILQPHLIDHDYCEPLSKRTCVSQPSDIPESNSGEPSPPFKFILDTCDIIVEGVEDLSSCGYVSTQNRSQQHYKPFHDALGNEGKCSLSEPHFLYSTKSLQFLVNKWSIQIWKDDIYCPQHFPSIVRIRYKTMPKGNSLLWVKDQDSQNCVFTYGAWINNRSLFPCQESPIAMATWEAMISVQDETAVVLMSGDKAERKQKCTCGLVHHYYYTKMILPLSTLALAVGFWQGEDIVEQSTANIRESTIKCRLFASPSLLSKATKEISPLVYNFVRAAEQLLTKYPFPRLDILIVPRCFGSLGMANPNIIFLSQSVLSGDGSMCIRLAHEIAHSWFGLLIGAYDWTEEWISEGFATFLEDKIFNLALAKQDKSANELLELRSYIRWRMLRAETENTEEDLQILRPTQGNKSATEEVDGTLVTFLKNGQRDDKKFIQIHYLKGYFLLHYLSSLVGEEKFMNFLGQYVLKFQGKLVLSKEFLEYFWNSFEELRESNITMNSIITEWLDTGGLPDVLKVYEPSKDNSLYLATLRETSPAQSNTSLQLHLLELCYGFLPLPIQPEIDINNRKMADKWIHINDLYRKTKKKRGFPNTLNDTEFRELVPEQIVLLLEILLAQETLSHLVLKKLSSVYNFDVKNADIQHRWCELVVKHRYKLSYDSVKYFLIEHQAMGVYLFGELMISNLPSQQRIAHECYAFIENEMEPPSRNVVIEMLGIKNSEHRN